MNEISINLQRFIDVTLESKVREGLEKLIQYIENDAKINCPTGNGELRASITHIIDKENGIIVAKIGSNLFYSPFVHQGTGIYAINGDGRKEVPWFYKDLQGRWYSTDGIKPTPFLQDAINANISRYEECFKNLL